MKNSLSPKKYFVLLALSALAVSCGVSTKVSGSGQTWNHEPVQAFVLIVQKAKFEPDRGNAFVAQRNLDKLTPHIASRLPVVFALNGIPMKTQRRAFNDSALASQAKILMVRPTGAQYRSGRGRNLYLRAELWDGADPKFGGRNTGKLRAKWYATIDLHTAASMRFDEKVAEEIAVKLLEQLRTDGVIVLAEGAIKVPQPTSDTTR